MESVARESNRKEEYIYEKYVRHIRVVMGTF